MSNNGLNYSMYNTVAYSQMAQQQQQQSFYGQRFPNSLTQPAISPYGAYPMYSSPTISHPPQYNSYDHLIQSAAETLAAFTHPAEISMINNSQVHFPSSNSHQSSTRQSIKKSFGATNSTRMYYCETCRIACGGHATYQAHLNGSKHKKKELLTQTTVNLSSKIGVHILRCELCDITCTSSDAYKAHLDGSKHEKAMKLHRKLGKTIPSTEPQILNNTSHVNSVSQVSTNGSQISTNDDQHISLSRLLENSIQPIGEEYIETTYDTTHKPILYHCKLCECKFNDIKGKDMHLKGKRHRLSYKKKVNPNLIVDNKFPSPKQKAINSNQLNDLNSQPSANNQSEIDDNTKYLMLLHEQIIPTPNFLNLVEEFVSTVESALKSCSEQLQTASIAPNSESTVNPSPLIGVSRIGLLGKSLIIKTDHFFHIVVICTEWPRKKLFQTILEILIDHFDNEWKDKIQIECHMDQELIELQTNTEEGLMNIFIGFTSPSISQEEEEKDGAEEFLSKRNCLNTLSSIHSTRWFQNQVAIRQHASALVRCLRYKTKISTKWKSLSSEAIEILIEFTLSQSLSAIQAFRRVLEYLAGGLVLSDGPGLYAPWQTDSIKDVFEDLTNQERNDITQEAQFGLRLMSFGQLAKWLEQLPISPLMVLLPKRSNSSDSDNQISAKRQCTEIE